MVGPSGAGKSTLGRLLAGIHGPRTGAVTVGGVPLVELPLDDLRGHVALVTQEHHVFLGTLRDNLLLARPDADRRAGPRGARRRSTPRTGSPPCPTAWTPSVGSGGVTVSPAQAQQLALARLVLADPHTLVLDEATSLIDPRAARHLERSLAAVLDGRTVIAIAHRLYTAHDADRVAVVEDGRITELGSHDELVAAGGSYAALWAVLARHPVTGSTSEPRSTGRPDDKHRVAQAPSKHPCATGSREVTLPLFSSGRPAFWWTAPARSTPIAMNSPTSPHKLPRRVSLTYCARSAGSAQAALPGCVSAQQPHIDRPAITFQSFP